MLVLRFEPDLVSNSYLRGGITDFVFDQNEQERRSWRFCDSRATRSEVVYFTQVFIIVFLIAVSLIKLVFFHLDCKESTLNFNQIFYFYQQEQPKFEYLENKLNIQFKNC